MPRVAKKPPGHKVASIEAMQRSLALQEEVVTEQRREIARLQRLLAKVEVKADSEIAAIKAKLSEEKKNKIKVVLQRFDKEVL